MTTVELPIGYTVKFDETSKLYEYYNDNGINIQSSLEDTDKSRRALIYELNWKFDKIIADTADEVITKLRILINANPDSYIGISKLITPEDKYYYDPVDFTEIVGGKNFPKYGLMINLKSKE